MVQQLAQREQTATTFSVSGFNIGKAAAVVALARLVDNHFSNWAINVLACDHVAVVVGDQVSSSDFDGFCDQVAAQLSTSCSGVIARPVAHADVTVNRRTGVDRASDRTTTACVARPAAYGKGHRRIGR